MKYFIIAGEKSGDLHASNLAKSIFEKDQNAQIWGWGGDKMETEGVKILKNYSELAFMGFIEVLKNIFSIVRFLREVKSQISEINPDVVILVDYAGFNLKILKWAKQKGYKTVYYIAPKAWAWQANRAKILAKYADLLLVIFPFEIDFFSKYGIKTIFVGNPLFDEISKFKPNVEFLKENNIENNENIIAVLPGSRKQEIENMSLVLQECINKMPEYQWVVAAISNVDRALYTFKNCSLVFDQTYDLLANAKCAVVTSGTATLETGLFGVPQVVGYKTSNVSYQIAKRVINVPYISLINLVGQKPIVTELIQVDFNRNTVLAEVKDLILNNNYREKQLKELKNVSKILGGVGASNNAALEILKII